MINKIFTVVLCCLSLGVYAQNASFKSGARPMVSSELIYQFDIEDELEETSGLIYYDGGVWSINDSGNDAILYMIEPASKAIVREIHIMNASNVDWEDLAQDDDYIYIGDFGDNMGTRDNLRVLKLAKSNISDQAYQEVTVDFITFHYKNRPDNITGKHNYDCEAFTSCGDYLYLFSKNRLDYKTICYRLPKNPGDYSLEAKDSFNVNGLVTGADYSEKNKELALIGYGKNYVVPFACFFYEFNNDDFFSGEYARVGFVYNHYLQTEGICYKDDREVYISCEGSDLTPPALFTFNTAPYVITGLGEVQTEDNLQHLKVFPNPCDQLQNNEVKVDFTALPVDDYTFSLYDTSGNELFFQKYRFKNNKEKFRLYFDVTTLEAGVYFIHASSKSFRASEKLIIY